MSSIIDLGLGNTPEPFIDELNLPIKTTKKLKSQNIRKINTLLGFTKTEIRNLKNINQDDSKLIIEHIDRWLDAQDRTYRTTAYRTGQSSRNPSIKYRHSHINTDYYSQPIDIIELPERAYNALIKNNINTVEQLLNYSYRDLGRLDGIGDRTLIDIVDGITYLERGRLNPYYISVKNPQSIKDSALGLNFTQRTFNALNEHFNTVLARRRRINERSDYRSKDVVHEKWNHPQDISIQDLLNIDIKTFMKRRNVGQLTAVNLVQTLYMWCLEHNINPVGFKVFEYDIYHNGIQDYLKEHGINVNLPNGDIVIKTPTFYLSPSPINMKRQRQLLININYDDKTYNVANGDECYIGYPMNYILQNEE